jgi:hypothetical protein
MQATVVAYSADVNLSCLLVLDAVRSIGRQRRRMTLPVVSDAMVVVTLAISSSLIAVAVVIAVAVSCRRR